MTAPVVGVFFLLALFFAPLASAIPPNAAAPAILFVACMMARRWPIRAGRDDGARHAAHLLDRDGIGLGLITYIALKALSGRLAALSPAVLLIGAVFVLHFALG